MKKIYRRDFLKAATAATAPLLFPPGLQELWAGGKKPNVLFIAVDDLKPLLGCYGNPHIKSPNIDRLARNGMVFLNTYCQQAVCAPSRASLMSGLRPDASGVHDLDTPLRTVQPDVVTLPQHFKSNAYTSLSLGKIYHHPHRDDPQGWSEREWNPGGNWMSYAAPQTLDYIDKLTEEAIKNGWEPKWQGEKKNGPATEMADLPDEDYRDFKTASQAIETMRRLKGTPFFLATGFYKPHLPFAAPKRYWDLYLRGKIKLPDWVTKPEGAPDIALQPSWELRAYCDIPPEGPIPEEKGKELIHGYYACVSFIDAQVGRLLSALDELGLADNTIVILWGDHGWHLGDHGIWCKHTNYEQATRSPMIISYPGMKSKGTKTKAMSEFVDIYPTLCELAGLPLPSHLEGTSLVPVLEDPAREWKKAAFSQYPRWTPADMGYSLRTQRYRYTEWINKKDGSVTYRELYDYEADPAETVNLAAKPGHEGLLQELARLMKEGWRGALPDGSR